MASLRPCTRQLLQVVARRYSIASLSTSRTHSHYRPIPVTPGLVTKQTVSLARCLASSEKVRAPSDKARAPSDKARAKGRRLQFLTGAWTALLGACYILYRQLNAKDQGAEGEEGKGEEKKEAEPGDTEVSEY